MTSIEDDIHRKLIRHYCHSLSYTTI